jgi:hypothetical protein
MVHTAEMLPTQIRMFFHALADAPAEVVERHAVAGIAQQLDASIGVVMRSMYHAVCGQLELRSDTGAALECIISRSPSRLASSREASENEKRKRRGLPCSHNSSSETTIQPPRKGFIDAVM